MTPVVRLALSPLFAAVVAVAAPLAAQAGGDAGNGARIAQAWCAGCHVAGDRGTDMAPPLGEIANWPGRDEAWFHTWLSDPHPPMPRLELSRRDIADLIAYLLSLQTN
ncbi:MAG: cytochrome c [Alphaproteobacteria bacterium]